MPTIESNVEKGKADDHVIESIEDENSCLLVNFFPAVNSTNEKRKAEDAVVCVNDNDDNSVLSDYSVLLMTHVPVQLGSARRGKTKQKARKTTNGEPPRREYVHPMGLAIPDSGHPRNQLHPNLPHPESTGHHHVQCGNRHGEYIRRAARCCTLPQLAPSSLTRRETTIATQNRMASSVSQVWCHLL